MKKETKKAALLKIAARVFSQHGFEKATLEDIGRAAALNKASLYYYFRNKEELFSEVVINELQLLIASLKSETKKFESAEEKILHYVKERWACYEKVLNLNQVNSAVREQVGDLLRELYHKVLNEEKLYLASIVKKGIEKKEFAATNASEVAELLLTYSNTVKKEEFLKNLPLGMDHASIYKLVKKKSVFAAQLILKGLKTK